MVISTFECNSIREEIHHSFGIRLSFQHPYPSEEQKKILARETNLNILQVNNWYVQHCVIDKGYNCQRFKV